MTSKKFALPNNINTNDIDMVAILRKLTSKNLYEWDRFNIKISKYVVQSVVNYLKLICEAWLQRGISFSCFCEKASYFFTHNKKKKIFLKVHWLAHFQISKFNYLIICVKMTFSQNVSLVFFLLMLTFHTNCIFFNFNWSFDFVWWRLSGHGSFGYGDVSGVLLDISITFDKS